MMTDERNDLIRVGDALDAITDWLCEEELRHNIEPNRRVNKFFAKVMLENVPRADRKTEQTEPRIIPTRDADWEEARKRIEELLADKTEPQSVCPVSIVFSCDECHREKCDYKDEPQTEKPCDNCQEFDCYGCEYKQTERSE